MAKHDRAKQEKRERNLAYALIYKPYICKNCKHKSCIPGRCRKCGAGQEHRKRRK